MRCLPRMRGDRPLMALTQQQVEKFTPHARGSTPVVVEGAPKREVYPACAGIDRSHPSQTLPYWGLPRMRGDRPMEASKNLSKTVFTPHARGSTRDHVRQSGRRRVYPACAGIDPVSTRCYFSSLCLPRMRGDRPCLTIYDSEQDSFTPHARGSTAVLQD